ncbi:MAG: hypothetical protein LBT23_08320 [Synergistaceae bacterium]|nr:hypothetical protein [Synergistaceae bacterium]
MSALLIASSFAPLQAEAITFTDAREKVIAYGVQIGLLTADLVLVKEWKDVMEDINNRAIEMSRFKHTNYANDHYVLSSGNLASIDVKPYIERFRGSGGYDDRFNGYREVNGEGKVHSDIYKERSTTWSARMKNLLDGNRYAVSDVINTQGDTFKMMHISNNVYGYTRQEEAGAQMASYLNRELSKLLVDVDRRLEIEAELAMNEQQKRTDETAAFASMVGVYVAPAVGPGY